MSQWKNPWLCYGMLGFLELTRSRIDAFLITFRTRMCSRVPITRVLGEIWSFNKNSLHLDIWTFGLDPPGGRGGVQGPQFEFSCF